MQHEVAYKMEGVATRQTASETKTAGAGGRRTRGPSRRVRAAAIAATFAELADAGYSALSLERVARRAGVNKTTLYRRWGTREELVLGPIHLRLLLTGGPVDGGFLEEIADVVVEGIASRTGRR